MLQNVVDLSLYLKELQSEGLVIAQEDVARLSPYLRKHIRRFGEYILDMNQQPELLSEDLMTLGFELVNRSSSIQNATSNEPEQVSPILEDLVGTVEE